MMIMNFRVSHEHAPAVLWFNVRFMVRVCDFVCSCGRSLPPLQNCNTPDLTPALVQATAAQHTSYTEEPAAQQRPISSTAQRSGGRPPYYSRSHAPAGQARHRTMRRRRNEVKETAIAETATP